MVAQLVQSQPSVSLIMSSNVPLTISYQEAKNCINERNPEELLPYAEQNMAHLSGLFKYALDQKSYACAGALVSLVGVAAFKNLEANQYLQEAFIQEATRGDCEACKALQNIVVGLKLVSETTLTTALIQAAGLRKEGMVDYLLGQGVSVNSQDLQGRYAISEVIQQFLEMEASLANPQLSASLRTSFQKKREDFIQLINKFVARGAKLELTDTQGKKIIERAAESGHLELLNLLKPELSDLRKKLIWVAGQGFNQWLQALITLNQAEAASEDPTLLLSEALTAAVNKQQQESVILLLMLGANPVLSVGETPSAFSLALNLGEKSIIRELFEYLYQRGLPLPSEGLSASGKSLLEQYKKDYQDEHPLIMLAKGQGSGEVSQLIANGIEVDASDKEGKTALYYAVYHDKLNLIEELLKAGADVNKKQGSNQSPLELAVVKYATNGESGLGESFFALAESANERSVHALLNYPQAIQYLLCKGLPLPMTDGKIVDEVFDNEAVSLEIYRHCQQNGPGFHQEILGTKGRNFLANITNKSHRLFQHNLKSALQEAVNVNDFETVQMLVEVKGFSLKTINSFGSGALHWVASAEGDVTPLIEYLLLKGLTIDVTDVGGHTPLHSAAGEGSLQMAKLLIAKGVSLSAKNKAGLNAYDGAVIHGHIELAKVIYSEMKKRGIESNASNYDSAAQARHRTVLAETANVEPEIVAFLRQEGEFSDEDKQQALTDYLAKGGLIDAKGLNGETALMLAVKNNDLTLVRLLIAKDASLNLENSENLNACHLAIKLGFKDIAYTLIDRESEKENKTLLYYDAVEAIKENQVEILDNILSQPGFDLNHRFGGLNHCGWTLTSFAASSGNLEILKKLKAHGANLHPDFGSDGYMPIHLAGKEGHKVRDAELKEPYLDCIKYLILNTNASVPFARAQDSSCYLLIKEVSDALSLELKKAVLANDENRVKELLEQGVPVDGKDEQGKTALILAVEEDKEGLISLLLAHGANPNQRAKNGLKTPLMIATETGKTRAWSALMRAHNEAKDKNNQAGMIDFNLKDQLGDTVLHYTMKAGKIDWVEFFIKKFGLNIDSKGQGSKTLLHLCGDNLQHVNRLLCLGANAALQNGQYQSAIAAADAAGYKEVVELYAYNVVRFGLSFDVIGNRALRRYEFEQTVISVNKFRRSCLRAYLNGCQTCDELASYSYGSSNLFPAIKSLIFTEMKALFEKAMVDPSCSSFNARLKQTSNNLERSTTDIVLVNELSQLEHNIRTKFMTDYRSQKDVLLSSQTRGLQYFVPVANPVSAQDKEKKELLAKILRARFKLDFSKEEHREHWKLKHVLGVNLRGTKYSMASYYVQSSNETLLIYKEAQQVAMLLDRYKNKGSFQELQIALNCIASESQQRNENNPSAKLTPLVENLAEIHAGTIEQYVKYNGALPLELQNEVMDYGFRHNS